MKGVKVKGGILTEDEISGWNRQTEGKRLKVEIG